MIVAMAWKPALKKDKKRGIQKNYLLSLKAASNLLSIISFNTIGVICIFK